MSTSYGNYYFYIVNRFDSLIYENEFLKPDRKVSNFNNRFLIMNTKNAISFMNLIILM